MSCNKNKAVTVTLPDFMAMLEVLKDKSEDRSRDIVRDGMHLTDSYRAMHEGLASAYGFCLMLLKGPMDTKAILNMLTGLQQSSERRANDLRRPETMRWKSEGYAHGYEFCVWFLKVFVDA